MPYPFAGGAVIDADDMNDLWELGPGRPFMRLVQQAAQSMADATDTALTFGTGSEIHDTHGFHSTSVNTSRAIPTVAGIYRIKGVLSVPALTTYASLQVTIRKNGSLLIPGVSRNGPNVTSSFRALWIDTEDEANGSTDYYEVIGNQDNTASTAQNTPSSGGSTSCTFSMEYLRPA